MNQHSFAIKFLLKFIVFIFLGLFPFTPSVQTAIVQDFTKDHYKLETKQSFYFPGGVLLGAAVQWYSKHLKAMKEPSLLNISKGLNRNEEVYRFLWLRSMFGHPICLRLDINVDGNGKLTVKETNGNGSGKPGALSMWKIINLDKFQTLKFCQEINRIHFWEGPSKVESISIDGARWILEGTRENKYKILDYQTPSKGNIKIVTQMLLDFSKSKPGKSVNFLNFNEVADPPVFP